jgi:adenine C2-methylase RlmN of 23S rRNA A2503 and tRNA A37
MVFTEGTGTSAAYVTSEQSTLSSDLDSKKGKSILNTTELSEFLQQKGAKLTHVESIQRHFIKSKISQKLNYDEKEQPVDYSKIPNLPKVIAQELPKEFGLVTKVITTQFSDDGTTTKLLIRLPSGALVETVIMRYDRADKTDSETSIRPRTTVCLSSQEGCKMKCSFCETGTMGFKSHLSATEILEQLMHANSIHSIDNVVFMGMGEPFDNYTALCESIQIMINPRLFALGPRYICVSTVGIIPKMRQFMVDCPGVKLALSLHAPTQEIRLEIVPTAKNYPLDRLMDAVDEYLTRNKRIMIEYILIRNLNCTIETAHLLGKLLQDRAVILNLIPYNPTNTGMGYEAPSDNEIDEFEAILRGGYQVRTTVRRTMGQDIAGACGQLVVKAKKDHQNNGCGTFEMASDMEDLVESMGSLPVDDKNKQGNTVGKVFKRSQRGPLKPLSPIDTTRGMKKDLIQSNTNEAQKDDSESKDGESRSKLRDPLAIALTIGAVAVAARLAWKLVPR